MPKVFHVLNFDRREEAAAFVAALSRVLNSPRGDTLAFQNVEVWSEVASTKGVRLYLSDAALEAARPYERIGLELSMGTQATDRMVGEPTTFTKAWFDAFPNAADGTGALARAL